MKKKAQRLQKRLYTRIDDIFSNGNIRQIKNFRESCPREIARIQRRYTFIIENIQQTTKTFEDEDQKLLDEIHEIIPLRVSKEGVSLLNPLCSGSSQENNFSVSESSNTFNFFEDEAWIRDGPLLISKDLYNDLNTSTFLKNSNIQSRHEFDDFSSYKHNSIMPDRETMDNLSSNILEDVVEVIEEIIRYLEDHF
jgi:hypothetical protein